MVAGYMAEEVSGLSAFNFMHKEDVNFTIVALQQMYDLSQGAGGSAYRLLAKTGRYIYLRTQGYLEFKKTANEETTLICINTLLTEEEGERLIQEMKQRYAASITKCFQITQTGGPLAKAVTPEYIPQLPAVMPASEPPLPSPSQMEEHRFVQPSPASDSALSPNQGASPGSVQFANMAIYSPPPPPVQPQPSPPAARYPGVITGPSSTPTSMDRPTVLRTQSVITERVSVLTTAGNPTETPMDTGSGVGSTERSHWGFKEVSVLKRTFSLDADASSSKRLHTGAPRPGRQRRRDSQPATLSEETMPLKVEVPHGAPVLSPEEQHQALMARGVPGHVPQYRGTWPQVPSQMAPSHTPLPDPSSSCLQMALPPAAAVLSPAAPFEPDPASPASLGDLKTDDLLGLDGVDCMKPEFIPLEALQACLDAPSAVESECAAWLGFADCLTEGPGHDLSLSAPGVDPAAVQAYSCVDRELERQHQQLQSRMAMQETQMSRLEQDLETVPGSDEPLRSTLSQLQAQHKKQRQMLHTLKQDHHCLQRQDKLAPGPCVKQNLGV
ncbi:Uncharacterized protein GBIM_07902 [Gryllus bimaculatus]|nr:Uncharacterized protein GBIM_07902 [Gryllus bimaculatus]